MCWAWGVGKWVCPERLRVIQRSKSMRKWEPDCKLSGGLTVSRELRTNSRKTWQHSVTAKPSLTRVGWRSGEEWLHALVLYLHSLIAHRCHRSEKKGTSPRGGDARNTGASQLTQTMTELGWGKGSNLRREKSGRKWMFSFDFSLHRAKSQQPIIQSRLYYELRHGKMMVMMVSILFAMLCKWSALPIILQWNKVVFDWYHQNLSMDTQVA